MVGRRKEIEELMKSYDSSESEFVAVYGRRRVGKTFLIRNVFSGKFAFQHSGLAKGGMKKQLRLFVSSLREFGRTPSRSLTDWMDAFDELKEVVRASDLPKKVVFIDEMPWLDTPRSDFITALESFWNGWASARNDVLLIVCGSAASWIVKKLFKNKGGLHNRVTRRIHLQPFTLAECQEYVRERGLSMSKKDIAECYMALGGIPFYWSHLEKGDSLPQNFDRMFFADGAPLKGEFAELYSSLFRKTKLHLKVVETLGKKKIGMTREELLTYVKIASSGSLSQCLEALEECGFIRKYKVIGTKKKFVYQLLDCFTLFHFQFLCEMDGKDEHWWSRTNTSPIQSNWRGLAFERLCLLHVPQIKAALGISGVLTNVYSWCHAADSVYPTGAQIDLLLDRADNVINLCEMKYTSGPYTIDKAVETMLETKVETFRVLSKTQKALHLTFVTSRGLVHNSYWNTVQSEVTLDDLFKE
ncbi:MAG: ATP-binding protein [Kiritimatiellae bacterium]|nr:ATP-binding protein [Kiritimatiellia bacterium]